MNMKILFIGLIILTMVASACTQYNAQTTSSLDKMQAIASDCQAINGNWLAEYNECESIPKENCIDMGGRFDECASACRHNPEAEMCTMQCVQVCSFA